MSRSRTAPPSGSARAGGAAATLAAQSCLTVFGVSFATWIADGENRPFAEISRDTLARLRALTG